MPALWPAFITTTGAFLDLKVPKSESSTANFIIDAYLVAVQAATIPMIPGSFILKLGDSASLRDEMNALFKKIKDENKIEKEMFNSFSNQLIDFWKKSSWSPTPPPPGYVGPNPAVGPLAGVSVVFGGETNYISTLFYNVFTGPNIPGPGGIVFATSLSAAFQAHLYSIGGNYNGLVPGVPSPVPGPPFPWQSII